MLVDFHVDLYSYILVLYAQILHDKKQLYTFLMTFLMNTF